MLSYDCSCFLLFFALFCVGQLAFSSMARVFAWHVACFRVSHRSCLSSAALAPTTCVYRALLTCRFFVAVSFSTILFDSLLGFFPVTFAVLLTILDSALLTLKFMFSTGLLKCLPPFLTLFFQFAFSFSPVVFQLDLWFMIMETTYNIVRARWTVITMVRYACNSGVRQRCSFMG